MHIVVAEAVAVMFGSGFTVSVTVAVPVHPATEVPVTEKVVVEAGVAVNDEPLPEGLQAYVFAPPAAMVELWPAHIAAGVALAVIVGSGLTVNVTVAVPVQPAADVPVTEYVVVDPGVAVKDDPVPVGIHA